jgi:hypothetical protein
MKKTLTATLTTTLISSATLASTYQSEVDVLVTLGQNEVTPLHFGRFSKPGAGKKLICDVKVDNDPPPAASGDAVDQTQYGTHSTGVIKITGDDNEDIDITIAAEDTASGGLLLSHLNAKYGSGDRESASNTDDISINDANAPTTSGTNLKVAGKITIDSNVSTGANKEVAYTVTVAYD